ncbi:hypothetical protein G6O69_16220 [Pseudenhygromyxa sp. WMMC2535]|uniref:hypothetical protein n=1 Tax=Pseudenhygromyxa sp. WMMC2535 TaxID=2712867 RepID=UPI001557086D|nr:hypothetical protein [Pseudenhygromyxa sp. WMMC2535]NVB39389.1 hypothetical protein [Pseudenhygromyxa sp. WMMC2535]
MAVEFAQAPTRGQGRRVEPSAARLARERLALASGTPLLAPLASQEPLGFGR